MTDSQGTTEDQGGFDHNQDRYPVLKDVLYRLLDESDLPEGPIEKVEVTMLPSGEANCRVWEARSEDPDVMYFGPGAFS